MAMSSSRFQPKCTEGRVHNRDHPAYQFAGRTRTVYFVCLLHTRATECDGVLCMWKKILPELRPAVGEFEELNAAKTCASWTKRYIIAPHLKIQLCRSYIRLNLSNAVKLRFFWGLCGRAHAKQSPWWSRTLSADLQSKWPVTGMLCWFVRLQFCLRFCLKWWVCLRFTGWNQT